MHLWQVFIQTSHCVDSCKRLPTTHESRKWSSELWDSWEWRRFRHQYQWGSAQGGKHMSIWLWSRLCSATITDASGGDKVQGSLMEQHNRSKLSRWVYWHQELFFNFSIWAVTRIQTLLRVMNIILQQCQQLGAALLILSNTTSSSPSWTCLILSL